MSPLGPVIVLSAAFAASTAFAADAAYRFIAPEAVAPARLLPAPPADSSGAGKREVAELHAIENARTPAQFARAKHDDETENASIFADVLGPAFDLAKLPATAKMFAEIRAEEKLAAAQAKDFFKRNRPWIVDASFKSCAQEDKPQSSYPSGHATMGYSFAVVLASIVPSKAQAILARADEYAENRLVCGMHFRKDIVAGQTLGTAVAVEMLQNSNFQADVSASAKELHAAHIE
jgi:acid phosphatase (class A)